MNGAVSVAPGVFRRPFSISRFINRLVEDGEQFLREYRAAKAEEDFGYSREEILQQFPPKARSLAR